ncbi:MAG: hypothetical protein U0835_22735 [Isosphaeraceae bacterium]
MSETEDSEPAGPRGKRERSSRYPGVSLDDCLDFCASVQDLGVDGLGAADIAQALGYKNIKTNTFSARLSGARQFGLIALKGNGYALTPLALSILHPVDPADVPRLHREALLSPPLYSELAERFAGKKVPDAAILGNVLFHHHQIIATAKLTAAEAFLRSARFAGALGDDQVLNLSSAGHAHSPAPAARPAPVAVAVPVEPPPNPAPVRPERPRPGEVRLDLRLWDEDEGKSIRLRAPQSITRESYERFLQALRLLVRIEPPEQGG